MRLPQNAPWCVETLNASGPVDQLIPMDFAKDVEENSYELMVSLSKHSRKSIRWQKLYLRGTTHQCNQSQNVKSLERSGEDSAHTFPMVNLLPKMTKSWRWKKATMKRS